ncbi:helix-turn-helix transcriptional regulator [Amycolatopsis cynarae]|uniref:Helix-turn-helix transcriptional regulator n=1 Tax=Amycolatopsis cynarae TaxID=2995223 RepID=A0ABY7B9F4_9PSEU|nr:helix-turn-helix transcriptional regulator [Amycolatopsis sp. HUAS 11-8]WAL68781.1 helix-turn-helix transcriptional regulator [Amycolatopsis sp. HUAS 11-8]
MTADQRGSAGGAELGCFLRARRAAVTPDRAGIAVGPGLRRTPGLRREELAALAGVSIDYYIRLERGKEVHPSPAVVESLGRALQLDEHEQAHLRELAARAARPVAGGQPAPTRTVPPGAQSMLESLRPNPAYVLSRASDLLAANPSGLRLLNGMADWPAGRRNTIRHLFLHPAARGLYRDWNELTSGCVARLRTLAGIEPDAPDVTGLIEELLGESKEFAHLWDRYEVRGTTHGHKAFRHPEVGDLTLGYQSMRLDGTPGQRLISYFAEPGTRDHDAVVLLDVTAAEHAATAADRLG